MKGVQLVQSSKKENVIEKTLDQLKETTTVCVTPSLMAYAASFSLTKSAFTDQLCSFVSTS